MNLPEIKQFRVDVSGKSPENNIPRERIPAADERSAIIVVPKHAPFFLESLDVYAVGNPNPLVKGEDYDFTSIDDELSEYAGAPVGWTIRKLKPNLPDLELTYQTLGTVPALTKTTKSWYESAAIDQRPVWFDQILERPEHWIPKLHGHDLASGFYYFQRLVRFYQERLDTLFGTSEMVPYRDWFLGQLSNLESYMIPYRTMMNYYTNKHYAHHDDPHRTTSRKVPGLDLIDPVKTATLREVDLGVSEQHRTLSAHAHRVIKAQGISVEDHVVPQFSKLALVGDTNHLRINRIATGLGDLKVSCWIGEDGKGYGLGEFWDEQGSAINHVVNPNPLDLNSLLAECQWKNTHIPFQLEGVNEPVTRMIPGGTGRCHIVGTKDRWYCRIAETHRSDLTPKVIELLVSGDFAENWSSYQMTVIDDHVWLTRTSDYLKNPTLIWYMVKLADVSQLALSEYTFSYKTLNDNTARNDSGKVLLFPRGFTGGKYTSGDMVFSKGVDLVDERQRIVLLPTFVDGLLHVEFILPEAFTYNGVTRRYSHAHMAKCQVNHATRKVTLTFTDTRSRPYVQTDLLFRPVPDANNYFEQIACQFPVTMGNLSGSVVMMDCEGFFGFGYAAPDEGSTYGYTFMPELYSVESIGRQWYLDVGTPWDTDRCGVRITKPVLPLDVNHPNGVQPYYGVMATSEKQGRTTLFKGWGVDGQRSWFVKTEFDDVGNRTVLGTAHQTPGFGGTITKVEGMDTDLCAGTYLSTMGTDFLMSVLSKTSKKPYLSLYSIVSNKGIKSQHYFKPTKAFLDLFGILPSDHWTFVSGRAHGFPDLMYVDRLVASEVRTTVHVFTMVDGVYSRVDEYLDYIPVTVLGAETLMSHTNKITTHTLPYGIKAALIPNPEVTLHAGSVNAYKDAQGVLTVVMCPKTQAGDEYEHVNLNSVLTVNANSTIQSLVSINGVKTPVNTYLTDELGWVNTDIPKQQQMKGLLNVGVTPPNLPSVPNKVSGNLPMAGLNTVLDTQHFTYYPPNISLGEHQQLIDLGWLNYDFRSLTPPQGEVTYTVVMETGYHGPYLWAVKGNVVNDGVVVVDTVTLNANGIK
ncbi:phage minor tail protein [Vibrio phage pTD1]|uniref:Phage minor tail protein n=1 Tax=Vibrio phage pTD1 TaxID=1938577 RepID=A0A1Q2U2R2_9CAUD|nr:minor tail protein [Vibrio phage pTD1]BAW98255.1 phage minor tail protein [Vibrio phage pTD1]